MSADLFHIGHLKAIRQCAKKGQVVIGLLTDEAIKKYKKRNPIIPFKQRKEILEALPEVYQVIKQNSIKPNLNGMNCLASGDGFEDEEIDEMIKYQCSPVEISYCKEQSTTKILKKIKNGNF